MILRLMILVIVGSVSAQEPSTTTNATTSIGHPNATVTAPSTTTPSPSSSSSSSLSSSASATSKGPPENCSACAQTFDRVYMNASSSSNSTTAASVERCPPNVHVNNSCVTTVKSDNCSVINDLLYNTKYSNVSFGLTCTTTGLQVVMWTMTNCTGNEETWQKINESNAYYCGLRGGHLNCSVDSNGIHRIQKLSVLDPFRKVKGCVPPTTVPPTIPLLPNPVGPAAITAIVVLVCLFIVAVLAGFFFWPKCHNPKEAPPTPKKTKQPPVEAINVVAYSATGHSATINVGSNVGPAA